MELTTGGVDLSALLGGADLEGNVLFQRIHEAVSQALMCPGARDSSQVQDLQRGTGNRYMMALRCNNGEPQVLRVLPCTLFRGNLVSGALIRYL